MVVLIIDAGRTLFLLSIAGGAAVIVPSEDGACDTDWFFPVNDEERHDPRMGEGFIEFTRDLWRKKELRVFFMNTPDDCDRDAKEILQIANEWHDCAQDVVPKFVECDKPKRSDIRVEYIGMYMRIVIPLLHHIIV